MVTATGRRRCGFMRLPMSRNRKGREEIMVAGLYLTPNDQGRPLTLEEFERSGSQEGYRYELIDGKLEVSPIPNLPHEELVDWLKDHLAMYAKFHPDILRKVK